MIINAFLPNTVPPRIKQRPYADEKHFFKIHNSLTEKQNSYKNDPVDIWRELAVNFDVRNCTFEELCEISTQLYQSGEISLREHAILTFDLNKAREHMQKRLQMPVNDFYLTPATSDGKRDWIKEYEARSTQDLNLGNLIGYENKKKVLGILKN